MDSEKLLDVSWKTILKISLTIIFFYIIYSIKDILVWFIFAVIISVLFGPVIKLIQRFKIPRPVAVVFVYVGSFGILSLAVFLVIPLFVSEIHQFLDNFPEYFEKVSPILSGLGFKAFENVSTFVSSFGDILEKMADNIFNVLFVIFGGVFSSLFIIITAVFLSLEERVVERTLTVIFPKKYESYILSLWAKCEKRVIGWFGARVLACLFIGVATYIALVLFNVKYPFALALFAGVCNFIPYFGPLFSGLLFFLLIFPVDMAKTIFVLIVFVLIQQVENHILSPLLMKKFVGLPPALVLAAMVVGGKLWGFLGAILVIPLAGILFEFFTEFLEKRKEKTTSQ